MKLKIEGLSYEVQFVEHVSKAALRWGEINYETQIIRISSDLKKDRAARILLHEIVHGILEANNYNTLNDDEVFVEAMARTLHNLILENKELILNFYKENKK